MKRMFFRFDTIYSRILFFNLAVVIGVTVIPILLSTNYFISCYNSRINQYNMQLARQVQNYIDATVNEKIIDIPNSYFSSLDLNDQLTYPYDNDISNDSAMMQEINTRLKNITDIYDFIDGINVYYPKSNIMFGVSGVSFVNDPGFPKMIQKNEAIVHELETIGQPTEWLTSVTLLGKENPSPAVFVKVLPYSIPNQDKKAVLAVGFNEDFFYRFISKISISKDETLLIVDPSGQVILSTDRKQNGTKLKDQTLLSKIVQGGNIGMLDSNFYNRKSVVSYSKSQYNDWRYVSVTSVSDYYQKSSQIRAIILLSLVLLLPVNLLFSAFLTKKAYKPLSQVIGRIKGMVAGNTADNNEYHFLEHTFTELNSRMLELNQRFEENKPLIRNNSLLKLLRGNAGPYPSAEQELAGIRFDGERMFCCMFRFFFQEDQPLESRLLVGLNLIPMLENLDDVDCKPVFDDNNRLTAIVNFHAEREPDDVFSEITQLIGSAIKIPYTVCVGGVYEFSPERVHLSYEEASGAYRYAFVHCDEPILRGDRFQGPKAHFTLQPKFMNKFGDSLRAGNAAAVEALVENVVTDVCRNTYDIESIRLALADLITLARMTAIDLGFDETDFIHADILAALEKMESIRAFEGWFKEIVLHITDGVHARRCTVGKNLEEKVRTYIIANEYQNISLESVADALHLSPGYLSKLFKTELGVNFTDYVVNLKMEEAVKLLQANKMTVKDISNALGYNTVQYFIRIFKEKYGYTPKMYQRSMSATQ